MNAEKQTQGENLFSTSTFIIIEKWQSVDNLSVEYFTEHETPQGKLIKLNVI